MTRISRGEWSSGAAKETPVRGCDHPGCEQAGQYRAPRSRDRLNDYYWFCLDHVRAYNAAWDYYRGMTPEEIDALWRQDVTWQRPTWPLGSIGGSRRFRHDSPHMKDPFDFFTAEEGRRGRAHANANGNGRNRQGSAEEKAMRVMQLEQPLTLASLKARYKELVKRHHPDANGGDKVSEERFKEINQAYNTLRASLNT